MEGAIFSSGGGGGVGTALSADDPQLHLGLSLTAPLLKSSASHSDRLSFVELRDFIINPRVFGRTSILSVFAFLLKQRGQPFYWLRLPVCSLISSEDNSYRPRQSSPLLRTSTKKERKEKNFHPSTYLNKKMKKVFVLSSLYVFIQRWNELSAFNPSHMSYTQLEQWTPV